MLVLSRHVGESIVINDTIRVTVVSVHGHKVGLGITAPDDVRVDRSEVHERRRFEAGTTPPAVEPTSRAAGPLRASLRQSIRKAIARKVRTAPEMVAVEV